MTDWCAEAFRLQARVAELEAGTHKALLAMNAVVSSPVCHPHNAVMLRDGIADLRALHDVPDQPNPTEPCHECKGRGHMWEFSRSGYVTCDWCGGTGMEPRPEDDPDYADVPDQPNPDEDNGPSARVDVRHPPLDAGTRRQGPTMTTDPIDLLAEYEQSKANPSQEWIDYAALACDLAAALRATTTEVERLRGRIKRRADVLEHVAAKTKAEARVAELEAALVAITGLAFADEGNAKAARQYALVAAPNPAADTATHTPVNQGRAAWRRAQLDVPAADTADQHTRTATPEGPDFCAECSKAANEWVSWPCPAADAERWALDHLATQPTEDQP